MGFIERLKNFFKKGKTMTDYSALKLIRHTSSARGTLGKLYAGDAFLCHTLEDPWDNNQKRISCIPQGTYVCRRHGWANEAVKFKKVWEVTSVHNRTAILIHAGNTIDDTIGCILVGTRLGKLSTKDAVLDSAKAIDLLRTFLPPKFTLEITGVVG